MSQPYEGSSRLPKHFVGVIALSGMPITVFSKQVFTTSSTPCSCYRERDRPIFSGVGFWASKPYRRSLQHVASKILANSIYPLHDGSCNSRVDEPGLPELNTFLTCTTCYLDPTICQAPLNLLPVRFCILRCPGPPGKE